jgi:NAD(P)-dependent dehydrogenase (short-subunit alcohol dehydrogenase family)
MLSFTCIMLLCPQASAFSLSMSTSKTTVVAGATGYIGKSVVRESVRQGYKTVALVRDREKVESKEGQMLYGQFFEGAHVVECDVADPEQLTKVGCLINILVHVV